MRGGEYPGFCCHLDLLYANKILYTIQRRCLLPILLFEAYIQPSKLTRKSLSHPNNEF